MSHHFRLAAFSLVELLVVLAILAIAASVAAPGFSQLMRQQEVRAAADELYSLLSFARAEAVTRGRTLSVSAPGADAWAESLRVIASPVGAVIRETAGMRHVQARSGVLSIAFSPDGRQGWSWEAGQASCIGICSIQLASECRHVRVLGNGTVVAPQRGGCPT